jgi:hypothetical protein
MKGLSSMYGYPQAGPALQEKLRQLLEMKELVYSSEQLDLVRLLEDPQLSARKCGGGGGGGGGSCGSCRVNGLDE